MMKSMFERRASFDEEEASSVASGGSNSSEGSRGSNYLGRLFGAAPPPPPRPISPILGGQEQTIIPQYKKDNRMLMRSPLPSPTATVRKQIVKPHVRSADGDSDSEEGSQLQKKREEAHVSRLVHMAKAQQNLMTAWFAASAGAESVMLSMGPNKRQRPKRARRQSSSGSAASKKSSGSGPVDLDSMTPWDGTDDSASGAATDDDAKSVGSQSSTGSSKLRIFLGGLLGSNSSVGNAPDQPSIMTGATPRIKNTAPKKDNDDIEMASLPSTADESTYILVAGRWKCSRNQIILWVLAAIFFFALISVIAAFATKPRVPGDNSKSIRVDESNSGDEVFITSPPFTLRLPTASPSSIPSASPSSTPSMTHPSLSPSLSAVPSTPFPSFTPTATPSVLPSGMPTLFPTTVPSDEPSLLPSSLPSDQPSSVPSTNPSSVPSSTPSDTPTSSPSLSQMPSLSPSSAPSTVFSTTTFRPLGQEIRGDQASEQFGYSSALNGAGTIMATGARYYSGTEGERTGRVEVFTRLSGEWTLMGQPIFGRNVLDQFGFSVGLSDDGLTVAASEPGFDGPAGDRSGNVRVFTWDQNLAQWTQLGSDIAGEERASLFGVSISLSADGRRIAVGSPYSFSLSGRVRIYEFDPESNEWKILGQALEGTRSLDWFGWSVDLSADGQRVAAGAPRNRNHGGFVQCFDFNGSDNSWEQVGGDIVNDLLKVHVEDRFGMAISLDGDRIAIGSPWKDSDSGAFTNGMVVVFELNNDWDLVGSPLEGDETNDQTGMAVQLRGDFLAVGSPGAFSESGKVSFHRFDGSDWDTTSAPLVEFQGADFGLTLAADRDAKTLAVGSPGSSSSADLTGTVKVFVR